MGGGEGAVAVETDQAEEVTDEANVINNSYLMKKREEGWGREEGHSGSYLEGTNVG